MTQLAPKVNMVAPYELETYAVEAVSADLLNLYEMVGTSLALLFSTGAPPG